MQYRCVMEQQENGKKATQYVFKLHSTHTYFMSGFVRLHAPVTMAKPSKNSKLINSFETKVVVCCCCVSAWPCQLWCSRLTRVLPTLGGDT